MKRFFRGLILFLVPIILFFTLPEIAISYRRGTMLSEQRLNKVFIHSGLEFAWIKKINHPDKVLLMGGSSVKFGLSCRMLNELSGDSLCFINMARMAAGPMDAYFLLKQTDLTHVSAVYFGLDPQMYTRKHYAAHDYLYTDLSLGQAIGFFFNVDAAVFQKRFKNLMGHEWQPYGDKTTPNDSVPTNLGTGLLRLGGKNYQTPGPHIFETEKYGWSGIEFEYLKKLKALCEEKHINFYTMLLPCRSDYNEYFRSNFYHIRTEFEALLKNAGIEDVPYGSMDQLSTYDHNLFIDYYHLSRYGQPVYTRIFYDMISSGKRPVKGGPQWFSSGK